VTVKARKAEKGLIAVWSWCFNTIRDTDYSLWSFSFSEICDNFMEQKIWTVPKTRRNTNFLV